MMVRIIKTGNAYAPWHVLALQQWHDNVSGEAISYLSGHASEELARAYCQSRGWEIMECKK